MFESLQIAVQNLIGYFAVTGARFKISIVKKSDGPNGATYDVTDTLEGKTKQVFVYWNEQGAYDLTKSGLVKCTVLENDLTPRNQPKVKLEWLNEELSKDYHDALRDWFRSSGNKVIERCYPNDPGSQISQACGDKLEHLKL